MSDADKASIADIRRLRLMQRMLRERGYVRDIRSFWLAPGSFGIRPEPPRDNDNDDDEE